MNIFDESNVGNDNEKKNVRAGVTVENMDGFTEKDAEKIFNFLKDVRDKNDCGSVFFETKADVNEALQLLEKLLCCKTTEGNIRLDSVKQFKGIFSKNEELPVMGGLLESVLKKIYDLKRQQNPNMPLLGANGMADKYEKLGIKDELNFRFWYWHLKDRNISLGNITKFEVTHYVAGAGRGSTCEIDLNRKGIQVAAITDEYEKTRDLLEKVRTEAVNEFSASGLNVEVKDLQLSSVFFTEKGNTKNWSLNPITKKYDTHEPGTNIDAWEKWFSYVKSWDYRNVESHSVNSNTQAAKFHFLNTLFHCCLKEKEVIENSYKAVLKEIRESWEPSLVPAITKEFMENKFTQLDWKAGDKRIEKEERDCVLIGDAGAGKSTQMAKLFWDEVGNRKKISFPVWIQVQDLSVDYDREEGVLEHELREGLGKGNFEQLMDRNVVTLYLDGLNEVVVGNKIHGEEMSSTDGQVTKRGILEELSALKSRYKFRVCVTDRRLDECLREYEVYECKGLTQDEEIKNQDGESTSTFAMYCERYWGEAGKESLTEKLNTYECRWFWETSDFKPRTVTPEQVNAAYWMLTNEEERALDNEEEFFFCYLNRILEREQYEKNDGRVPLLKWLLHKAITLGTGDEILCWQCEKDRMEEYFKSYMGNEKEVADYYRLALELPLIVEETDGEEVKVGFVNEFYKQYFEKDELILV